VAVVAALAVARAPGAARLAAAVGSLLAVRVGGALTAAGPAALLAGRGDGLSQLGQTSGLLRLGAGVGAHTRGGGLGGGDRCLGTGRRVDAGRLRGGRRLRGGGGRAPPRRRAARPLAAGLHEVALTHPGGALHAQVSGEGLELGEAHAAERSGGTAGCSLSVIGGVCHEGPFPLELRLVA